MKTTSIGALGALALCCSILSAQAAPVQWTVASGGNGHFYEFVVFTVLGELNWLEARDAAEAAGGYLATITSAGEQTFLESIDPPGTDSFWIGASDATTEGVWRWETGPETGTQFWQGLAGGSTTAPFNYAKWKVGEPNNAGDEDYATFIGDGFGWNDDILARNIIRGYVFETPVPLPAPIWLICSALGLIGIWRKRSI